MSNNREKNLYIKQSLILGALLHDIGKVLNRVKGVREKHPIFSKKFILEEEFIIKLKNWIDPHLLSSFCQIHHEHPAFPDELLVQKIEDSRLRALAYIVSRADNYSSSEREEKEKSGEDFRKTRLLSIFSKVNIGKGTPKDKYYELKPLAYENVFPIDKEIAERNENGYRELVTGTLTQKSKFSNSIKYLQAKKFDHFFNGLLSILEENLWCVPSDTRFENQDISLFDHLLTTSAIAACLYEYHKNNLDETKIKDDKIEKFLLVGGNISRIQNFLFEITSTNPKKLSKILRGRSFYLQLLTECASLKILKILDLPLSCLIMNAGGRFIILTPNIEEVRNRLKNLIKEINEWFLKTFIGKLSLNIDYSLSLSGNDFKSENFNKKLKHLNQILEIKKMQKFNEEYFGLKGEPFKDIYSKLSQRGTCEFCGTYPRENSNLRCEICKNSEIIGKEIISKNFICFTPKNSHDSQLSILDMGIDFLKTIDDPSKYYLIEKISNEVDEENFGYIKRHMANYIPESQNGEICLAHEHKDKIQDQECNSLCKYCKEPCPLQKEKEDELSREEIKNSHLTFQCIATNTLKENNGMGVDHLAVLKADVDFLGMIFGMGIDDLSISRFATLSRMFNYFFSSLINHLIKTQFKKIYTVYTGGDDMLLIGPWEQILEFSLEMQNKFREYIAQNPNITISAGISLFKPHSQVKLAAEIAEENLEKSKSQGKDRLTVFGTTVNWGNIKNLIDYKNFLNNEFKNKDSRINSAFLYRLLKYQTMFIAAEDEGKIENLRFHSLLTRDVKRNIEIKDKEGNIKNQQIIYKLIPLYAIGENQNKELMRSLKIPVFWTLYKNRGGAK